MWLLLLLLPFHHVRCDLQGWEESVIEDSAMEGAIDGLYAAAEEVEKETGKYVGIWNRHKVYFYRHPTLFQKIRPPTSIY